MSRGNRAERQRARVRRAVKRHSYCVLATSSAGNRPHAAGVLYAVVDDHLFIATLEGSVKARNVRQNGRVAVCVPVRRFPVGPPFAVYFQGAAKVVAVEDPLISRVHEEGRLKRVTSHGELDHADTCFLLIEPGPRIATYGLGVPLLELLRDPLAASGAIDVSLN